MSAGLLAALFVGVVAGLAASRRLRLGRRTRRLIGVVFAASVSLTLFAVGASSGGVDYQVLPLALLYAAAAGAASVAAAWAVLRLVGHL